MVVVKKNIIVKNKQGLHARPAASFVQLANKFESTINIVRDQERVNGKSIMGILMLGAEQGCSITIEAEGKDAEQAVLELEKVLTKEEQT